MKRTTLAIAAVAAISAAACLQKDTTSTIYLRPDGSFDWVVLERNVRSDETDAAKRLAEEAAFVDAVARSEHGVVEGMLALGAEDVQVRWLRSRRPYGVMIDARFDSLTGMFDRLLSSCGIPHDVGTTEADGVTTWRLWMDVGIDGEGVSRDAPDDCDKGLGGMSDALDDLIIILESGTFTAASGFTLEGNDTAAADEAAIEQEVKTSGRVELSLSWKAR